MVTDAPRNEFYRKCIHKYCPGKVVIDVGCGTGLLSMMAARAGAAHVFAIEASPLASIAKRIIDENGLGDVVTVLAHRVEDVVSLPRRAEVLVSEWMGFYLLHEAMLASVVDARDRLLEPGGVVIPTRARLFATLRSCPSLYEQRVALWSSVEGFEMRSMVVSFADRSRANAVSHQGIDCM